MRLAFTAAVLALAAPVLASDLVGPESCRACHAEAYRIWSQSPHARAVDSFTPDQRRSALCLSCHSRDEQRSNPADPVAGVSCESCHGGGDARQGAGAAVRHAGRNRDLRLLPRAGVAVGAALRRQGGAAADRSLDGRAREKAAGRAGEDKGHPARRVAARTAMSETLVQAGPLPGAVSEVAQLPPEESNALVEQVFRFFCSLRLTLANLLLLFMAMIAGTFVNPQNDSLLNIERAFANRPVVLGAYRWLELYDLFHSWWFTLLLVSLALNLIACSVERIPRIWYLVRYPETRLDHVVGLRFRTAVLPTSLSAEAVAEQLRARKYSVRAAEGRVFAEKGRYARFGVWVVHLSL